MSTTYEIIGLDEVEKKKGLTAFSIQPTDNITTFTTKEPVLKTGPKATLVYDRGRKRTEKGKLF